VSNQPCRHCGEPLGRSDARCPRCGLAPLDEAAPTLDAVTYDLSGWFPDSVEELERRLRHAQVPFTFDGGALSVVVADPTRADGLVDDVEAQFEPGVPPGPSVTLPTTVLDPLERADLRVLLHTARIGSHWGPEAVVVGTAEQARVEHLIATLAAAGGEPTVDTIEQVARADSEALADPGADPGDVADEAPLGDLFDAVDHLHRKPLDEASVAALRGSLAGCPTTPPFGITQAWWDDLLADAGAVATGVAGWGSDEIRSRTEQLLTRLRGVV
jgi:hypothetical protein